MFKHLYVPLLLAELPLQPGDLVPVLHDCLSRGRCLGLDLRWASRHISCFSAVAKFGMAMSFRCSFSYMNDRNEKFPVSLIEPVENRRDA